MRVPGQEICHKLFETSSGSATLILELSWPQESIGNDQHTVQDRSQAGICEDTFKKRIITNMARETMGKFRQSWRKTSAPR